MVQKIFQRYAKPNLPGLEVWKVFHQLPGLELSVPCLSDADAERAEIMRMARNSGRALELVYICK